MLCALVRGQHCQTLHFMNLGQVRRNHKTSHIFCIDQIVKQSTPSREQPILLRPRVVADSMLCVATVLDQHIDRTSSLQGEEQQLFGSYAQPHHGVSKDTISRWIKTVTQQDGVDTTVFKPHSTRAASTSKAHGCNVSLPAVMKAASWTSDCVFNKPVQPQNLLVSFSHAILSAAVKTHCLFTSLSGQFSFCKVTVAFCAIIYAWYTFYLVILYNKLGFDFLSDHINLKFGGISTVDD